MKRTLIQMFKLWCMLFAKSVSINWNLISPVLIYRSKQLKIESVILVSILINFYSCTNDLNNVEVELSKGFVSQLAVSSFLNPDSILNLYCMATQVAFSKKNLSVPIIVTAIIEDITNGISYPLTHKNKNNLVLLSNPNISLLKGNIYEISLKTTNPSSIVSIRDTVPAHEVKITNVTISPILKTSSYFCTVNFIPTFGKNTAYYELLLWYQNKDGLEVLNADNVFFQTNIKTGDRNITREDYYPSLLLLEAEYPKSLLFRTDKKNQNEAINFEYNIGEGYYAGSTYTWDHNIKIEIRTVSHAYFQYKTSLYKQKYAAEGDLLYGMASPVKVYSNVDGGVGVLGSYCKKDTTVFVEGRTNIDKE